jgi:hypothetical protein
LFLSKIISTEERELAQEKETDFSMGPNVIERKGKKNAGVI